MNTVAQVIARSIRPEVLAMSSYVVQPKPGLIKLDAMENPFALPESMQEALGQRLGRLALNRYPGSGVEHLRSALLQHLGLGADAGLVLGNGSDELITLLSMACGYAGAVVMSPAPSFVMYEISARLQGLAFVGVPLKANFELDEQAMLAAIETHQPALIYFACPNNPTTNLFDAHVLERLILAAPGLVVLDEAYWPFSSRNHLSWAFEYPNVVVIRTLSKFGLAGVRIGYMVGPKAWCDQVDKVRPPYNVSVLNAEAALFALEHIEEFKRQAQSLCEQREYLVDALRTLGWEAFPSEANMLLVRTQDADAVFAHLWHKGISVKNVAGYHPLLKNCVRITVGSPEENHQLLSACKAF